MSTNSSPGTVSLSATLQGIMQEGGPLGPIDLGVTLSAQAYAFEVKDYRIPTSAALPGTPAGLAIPVVPALLQQSLILVTSDQAIELSINGAVAPFVELKPGRVYLVMGPPAVTQIDFGNPGGLEAKVYVLQLVEPS